MTNHVMKFKKHQRLSFGSLINNEIKIKNTQ
jgi:hypothetical protein